MGTFAADRTSLTVDTPSGRSLETTVFYPTIDAHFPAEGNAVGDAVNINHVIEGAARSYVYAFLMPLLHGVLSLAPMKIESVSKLDAKFLDRNLGTTFPL